MVNELVEKLKGAAGAVLVEASSADEAAKKVTDKIAGLLKKHYKGTSTAQWWQDRKYPGTVAWLQGYPTYGIRVGCYAPASEWSTRLMVSIVSGDRNRSYYSTPAPLPSPLAVFSGALADADVDRIAKDCIKFADEWAARNGKKLIPDGPTAGSAADTFDGAKASTFGSRLTKALPGKLQSYTTQVKDRALYDSSHKPNGLMHQVALWFGKSGKLTKDELGKLPTAGTRRLEAFYVQVHVIDGAPAKVIVTAKSGVYGDDWAKAIDKSDIEMRTVEVEASELLGSGLAKVQGVIADMYGDFAKKAEHEKAEAGELNAETIGEKLADLWEMQKRWRALRQERADLIASHNAAMKRLEKEMGDFEGGPLKKVTDWMVKHGMRIVPTGTMFLVNHQTNRTIGSDTPSLRAGAIAQHAKEKLGIDLPDSVTHKGEDGWKDPMGQSNVAVTYFSREVT